MNAPKPNPSFSFRPRSNSRRASPHHVLGALGLAVALLSRGAEPTAVEVRRATVNGQLDGEKARLVIEADLSGLGAAARPALYGATFEQHLEVGREQIRQRVQVQAEALQGELRELVFALAGEGEVREVRGEGLSDWAVRQTASGRQLVVRLTRADPPLKRFTATIQAVTPVPDLPHTVQPLTLATEPALLAAGYLRVDAPGELAVEPGEGLAGLVPIEPRFLPPGLRPDAPAGAPAPLAFRFQGALGVLPLKIAPADPEARQVTWRDFQLHGELSEERARFRLTARARVPLPRGGRLEVLGGEAALAGFTAPEGVRLRFERGAYVAEFDRAGEFPLAFEFDAAVRRTNGWREVFFTVAPAAVLPVTLTGLSADTQLRCAGAARPERRGEVFESHLPPDGRVRLAWQEGRPEAEGRLFFAAEALEQVTLSPGLLRQAAALEFRVMQGEMQRVVLALAGGAAVTRVQGGAVLSWEVLPAGSDGRRRLQVQLNAPQKDTFHLSVHLEQALDAFPQTVAVTRLAPEGATRFAGYLRVAAQGAVRLDALEAAGLAQISPEQIPASDTARALAPAAARTVFAYRFAGPDQRLRLQADDILPELAVSAVLAYHLGETELGIEAEFEVDVREAPLREVQVRVPAGFTVVAVQAAGMSEYTVPPAGEAEPVVRVLYGAPVLGRQLITLRLERNETFREPRWTLPRLEVLRARSTRGHVGVSADAGFRLTPAAATGLTELATAFFPKPRTGLQAAFRITEPAWSAALVVERLPQTVQVDAFHLFSVGEGVAYGSSVLNYLVSGAPVSAWTLELPAEVANVEFTGKHVRGAHPTTNGYRVELSQPVSGPYTLLVTYDRPFKAPGDQLAFTGARPLEVQAEQGYTVVVSTYQFQVRPVNVSPALLALEPGELPAEYRLLFDAPVLAAYRYTARPFNLELALQPLAQGEMLSQVVDRAALTTRISREGQVVTEARYFVKNKGTPHLQLILPPNTTLWSVLVNSNAVVPVRDGSTNLIRLPQHSDPNTLNQVVVKLAATNAHARRFTVATPAVTAPVLLADWRLETERDRRLVLRSATLPPATAAPAHTGFAALARIFTGPDGGEAAGRWLALFGLVLLAALALRWLAGSPGGWFAPRRLAALAAGLLALFLAARMLWAWVAAQPLGPEETGLRFVAPVLPPGGVLRAEVQPVPLTAPVWGRVWSYWPAALALVAWAVAPGATRPRRAAAWRALGWTALAWAALRQPDGGVSFAGVVGLFLAVQLLVPLLRRWWRAPVASGPAPGPAAAAVVGWIGLGLGAGALEVPARAAAAAPPVAAQITQEVRAEDEYVLGEARLRWQAATGQTLPVLEAPGVLTGFELVAGVARLVQGGAPEQPQRGLLAETNGWIEAVIRYQTRVEPQGEARGFRVPVPPGLVNRLTLTVAGQDVDVFAEQAVSVQRRSAAGATNTVVELVLRPAGETRLGWRPRQRDPRREAAVFYAEWTQVYVPASGAVEGLHAAQVRPARGELAELVFDVPPGAAVTDVTAPGLAGWRFDPDTRQLRARLSPAQARPFAVQIRSQSPAGTLPAETRVGLVRLRGAASEVGVVGVATGSEVQLEAVDTGPLAPINLEDFPAAALEPLAAQAPGLAVRRAFRYANTEAALRLRAAPVEPEVRVESQQTLSLGEDRVLLAATWTVDITQAGIFRLSFSLPPGLEVETLSGAALSHWTELRTDATNRVITLHLKGRTLGPQTFALTLAGPGVRAAPGWAVPVLRVREASRERGQLFVAPEQGLRVRVAAREGVVPFDPAEVGSQPRGVLAFRLLQSPWRLTLDLEPVDAWLQVTSLQHVTVGDARLQVQANLQYEIENTGVKTLRVRLPAAAENVRFRGEQVADFAPREDATNAVARVWEVKLHRRVLGRQLLQVSYTLPVDGAATAAEILSVQALEVNLQRGFLTVQAAGRLQARVTDVPPSLQPTEWQVIPRALLRDITAAAANYTFRLIEPDARLTVRLERHQAASLLPARVNRVELQSVVADDGGMLTRTRVELVPGDKRLLHLRLPAGARFWFAFVNQNSVWPWNDGDQVLIPLEQHAGGSEPVTIEFYHTSPAGRARPEALDLALVGPRLDLPLENVTWQVFLHDRWRLKDWSGTLQLQETATRGAVPPDLEAYLAAEWTRQREQNQQAEQFLSLGNRLLEAGDAERARQAFKNAFQLSSRDAAFNEDARVQLQNLKMQQALRGLNLSQNRVAGQGPSQVAAPATPPGAAQLPARGAAEEDAVPLKLAQRLIQQQEAAAASPSALRVALPEQGRVLTFTRPLAVEPWAELKIALRAAAVRADAEVSGAGRLALLAGLLLAGWVVLRVARSAAKPAGDNSAGAK
jgi:hypothetical protein